MSKSLEVCITYYGVECGLQFEINNKRKGSNILKFVTISSDRENKNYISHKEMESASRHKYNTETLPLLISISKLSLTYLFF